MHDAAVSRIAAPAVAFFSMGDAQHFHRLRSLIAAIAARGIAAHVFTDRQFAAAVERAGGRFVDVFAGRPLAGVDDESAPLPARFVTFAGCHAGEIAREVAALRPSLVIYEQFAVVGRVVARMLRLPHVNLCAGHAVEPARFLQVLASDPRVAISPRCHQAVETLRGRYGIEDASPFSYVSALSPFLNLYCEPPAFLTGAERRVFDPVAFWGSLPPLDEIVASLAAERPRFFAGDDPAGVNVYVSFGTVVWRYFARDALAALGVIADCLASMPHVRAVVSLGRAEIDGASRRALTKANVAVESYVDQWAVLHHADVFITHNGLNSTHEAIVNRVPMVSYPFFWDQPAMAEKCRAFGLALPLADSPRAPIAETHVRSALAETSSRRPAMRTALCRAREWELEVIANRDAVVERIVDLIRSRRDAAGDGRARRASGNAPDRRRHVDASARRRP